MSRDYRSAWRYRGAVAVAATWAVLGLSAAEATAQGEPPSPARLRLGPLTVFPTVTLRDIGVDSNVYNQVDKPVSDFTFVVAPAFLVNIDPPWASIVVRSATDMVYFVRQSSERSFNQNLTAAMRVPMRRITPYVDAAYLNTRERPNQEIDARARRIVVGAGGGADVMLWPKLLVNLAANFTDIEFDADAAFDGTFLGEVLNQEMGAWSASVRYVATPLTSFFVSHDTEHAHFTRAPHRDSTSRRISAGFSMRAPALFYGNARIGKQRFRPDSAAIPDFDGIVAAVDIGHNIRPSTSIGVLVDRNLAYSYLDLEPYYIRQGFAVYLRRQIVERWHMEARGGRYAHKYRAIPGATQLGVPPDRSERFIDAGVSLGFQARPNLLISGGLSYRDRNSKQDDRNYDSLRMGTSISYGF